MNKSNFKTLIFLFIIFLIIGIFLFIFSNNYKSKDKKTEYKEIILVNDPSTFFSVTLNINKFSQYISDNDKVSAYNILDKDFAIKNNITIDNIIDIYGQSNANMTFTAKEMYVISENELYKYYVKGYLKKEQMDVFAKIESEVYYILNYDINNRVFSLELINEQDYQREIKSNNFDFKKINTNGDNMFEYTTITKSTLVNIYFYDFIRNIFSNPQYAYNSLTTDTKNIYFDTYDKFINEISNNNEYYSNIKFLEYNISNNIYYYKDNYGNVYTFIINGVMNYTVTIDFSKEE